MAPTTWHERTVLRFTKLIAHRIRERRDVIGAATGERPASVRPARSNCEAARVVMPGAAAWDSNWLVARRRRGHHRLCIHGFSLSSS
jgi:hypothetical protein